MVLEEIDEVEPFEIRSHTADTSILVRGRSVEELFANAGRALFELMFEMEGVEATGEVTLSAEGDGLEELLVSWLSELLAFVEVHRLALFDFRVVLEGDRRASASARSVRLDSVTLVGTPIKAVTYHDLAVEGDADSWTAAIVFDV